MGGRPDPGVSERVLVTGANGFLGGYVRAELLRRGMQVRGAARVGAAPVAGFEAFPIGGLEDASGLAAACEGCSAVVHLAARVHVMHDRSADPLAAFRAVNVAGTRTVLRAAAAAGARRFVFVSSVKAVGESNSSPWRDDVLPSPVDPYGISKVEAERLVLGAAGALGLPTVVLRLPLAYGAGMRGNMLQLFRLVSRGVPLPVAAVRNRRSMIFAGNVAWAIAELVAGWAVHGAAFFLSDGEDLSTPELIRRIARALGRRARLVWVPVPVLAAAGRAGDLLSRAVPVPLTSEVVERLAGSLSVDASRFASAVGRMPHTVDQGLAETAAWFRRSTGR